MRKKHILIFWVWIIMTLNPSFKVNENPSNYNIFVSTEPFSNLKVDMERYHRTKSMIQNPFWYFDFLP